MEPCLNTSDLDKSFINFENNSSNDFFSCLNLESPIDNVKASSFLLKDSFESSDDSTSDKDSIKFSKQKKYLSSSVNIPKSNFNLNKKETIRKDLYGNIIKKGGKHKVSFKDNIKGKLLVEMTLIDVKQSSVKGKNYKKYTVNIMARDKRESSLCNIF